MEIEALVARALERKEARSQTDVEWRKIAKLLRLLRDDFGRTPVPGEARGEQIYDSTQIYAAENLSAGIYGMMTNPATSWFSLVHADASIGKQPDVADWLSVVSSIVLKSFGASESSFYSSVPQLFGDFATFGMGVFYSDEIPAEGRFHDVTIPLAECYIAVNQFGEVDTLDRIYSMSLRAIARQFGTDNLPDDIKRKLNEKPDELLQILHCVYPNESLEAGKLGARGKAFLSKYILLDQKHLLEEKGYWEFPYMVPRWSVASGEVYGRGPAMNAMPDIKMLQAMQRTLIQTAERQANPPILAPQEGAINVMRTAPGRVTYGAMSRTGQQLVRGLETGGNATIALEMIDRVREQIKDAFYFTVMQLVGRTGMTATEVATRNEEKMRLMGPHTGRVETEFLTKIIARRFNMLYRGGRLPPAPPALSGQPIQVQYESAMAKAQKSSEGVATMRFLEGVGAVAQLDPSITSRVNGDGVIEVLQEAFGAPSKVLLSMEQAQQRRAAAEQQQQLSAGLAAGQQGADILTKLTQAQVAGAATAAAQ